MNFSILASVFVIIILIAHNIRKSKKIQAETERLFWERETKANQVRRKPLDGLDYVKIPLDALPMELMREDERVAECLEIINSLSSRPIVNLTSYSNTDLKLEYGTANITALSEYDQNYTTLVTTLQKWANVLYGAGHTDEACRILEFAVGTRTDISRSYTMLAEIYTSRGTPERIQELIKTAESVRSLNQKVILKHLNEFYQ